MRRAPAPSGGLRARLAQFLDPNAEEQTGAELSRAVSAVLTTAMVVTNLIGAAVVLAVIYLILPLPPTRNAAGVRTLNAIVAGVYIPFAVVAGALGGRALLGRCSAGCTMSAPPMAPCNGSSCARPWSYSASRSACG